MALPVSGTQPSAVYSTVALVKRYLPANAIAGTAETTPQDGIILYADVEAMLAEYSRITDGKLSSEGFEWPFPDISETNPSPPALVVKYTTYSIVAECRRILQYGNDKSGSVDSYDKRAEDILTGIIDNPKSLGDGEVTVNADCDPEPIGDDLANDEYGPMYGNLFRLKNRNVYEDSLRFVKADGSEAFKSTGTPFSLAEGDFRFHSQAEGLVWLYTIDQMRSAVGVGGGLVYRFSWRKLDWGQSHPTVMPGVGRI